MKTLFNRIINNQLLGNTILFTNIIILMFSVQLFSDHEYGRSINRILFNVLIVMSMLSIKKGFNKLLILASITIISTEILSFFVFNSLLDVVSEILKLIFFTTTVYLLFLQLVKSKYVDKKIILEAINVYLLIAIIGSLFAIILYLSNNDAFLFNTIEDPDYSDFFYFSTVTITTIGYGDITPVSNSAQLLTMLLGISGQLYMTLVLAMLVGKFLNTSKN